PRELYARLEAETGHSTGWKRVGFIELASDDERLEEYRRAQAFAQNLGVEVHEISPTEVKRLFPLANVQGVRAGFYVPDDGRVDPLNATWALAEGARRLGVNIIEGVPVRAILTQGKGSRRAVCGVRTDHGEVLCEYVVLCAGVWSQALAARHGVLLPSQAVEHVYLVTDRIEGIGPNWPILEDPGLCGYYREESGGLLIGLFELNGKAWKADGIPEDFSFGEIAADWDRVLPYFAKAIERVPIAAHIGIRKFFCGPESFTPDLRPILGESPEIRGLFVATGMNSIGVLSAGGIGKLTAEWLLYGSPSLEASHFHIERFQPFQNTRAFREARAPESLGLVFECHHPFHSMKSARGIRRSPLHTLWATQNARWIEKAGWEVVEVFLTLPPPSPSPPLGFGPPWFWSDVRREFEAALAKSALFDLSFLSLFELRGPNASTFLDRLAASPIPRHLGEAKNAFLFNDFGHWVADPLIICLDENRFWLLTSPFLHRRLATHLLRHASDQSISVELIDHTGAFCIFALLGPSTHLVFPEAFTSAPFSLFEIELGFVPAQALHLSHHLLIFTKAPEALCACEWLLHQHPLAPTPIGFHAWSGLRLRNGLFALGEEVSERDHPVEIGLASLIDWEKPFVGKASLCNQHTSPPRRILAWVETESPLPLIFGGEILLRNGERCGIVRKGSYDFSSDHPFGVVMLEAKQPIDADWLQGGEWELQVGSSKVKAKVHQITKSLQ
ncbi:MAG: FAD-dependent oxidoreductase, partial [Deltaproteobacteria bacterium]|nr:FAD-dependent oxidoreductase [Deltaproteobacteria bacterium]